MGRSLDEAYALYERYGVLSQAKSTLAGQDRLYDIVTFNGWVAARLAGSNELAAYYERRFRPEYAKAFAAWIALDPPLNLRWASTRESAATTTFGSPCSSPRCCSSRR